jgi:hypothetical protein
MVCFLPYAKKSFPGETLFLSAINPEFAVSIYYGLQILAATLVYCFNHPVLLTGPQRETIGTFVPYLFHPPDETKQIRIDTTCKVVFNPEFMKPVKFGDIII